ncbi:ABC transporter permease [Alicyclobacillus mengziensis]|uniref:Transport permease protein n=1 Tax=Alicyclobacillus mengziensis TaxID=2931921 RepID=A0A9X7VXY6_9BACL|nr:ABC transporter permease [Alicyclobacillus mengziensis]QSO45833.1 ABC transporter permease [Alicyclobacillus mengziensis]
MNAFLAYLSLQLKLDVRDRGTLLNFYLVPLLFFFVVGAVFASVNPLTKTTLAASMSVFAVTMGAVMGFPPPLVKLRETGTMRAFAVNGIPGPAVLAVHALSAFVHLLVVATVIGVAAPLVYHASVPNNPSRYAVVLVVLLFASISIGLAIGVTARSQTFTAMFSMLVFLPSLLLSGVMFPTSMLPKILQWVGYIFPATYVLQSFYGWAYHAPTHMNPGVSLLAATIIGMALLTYALWKYGRNNKMELR